MRCHSKLTNRDVRPFGTDSEGRHSSLLMFFYHLGNRQKLAYQTTWKVAKRNLLCQESVSVTIISVAFAAAVVFVISIIINVIIIISYVNRWTATTFP